MVAKIKVLLVATEFAPGMIPFAATVINVLANDDRFDVRCICVNSGEKKYNRYIADGMHSEFIEYPQKKWKKAIYKFLPFSIIKAIKNNSRRFKPDCIHFLTGDFSLSLYIRLFSNKKMCYTVHDLHPHEVQNFSLLSPVKKWVINGGYKICRDYIHNLTSSSKEQIDSLIKMYPAKRVVFTPFPTLVTSDIRNGRAHVRELEGCQNYILFFGNVMEYKGVDLLQAAFEQMGYSKEIKLVIAGKGAEYFSTNPNIIRLNRFFDDKELKNLFTRALFVVYPYKSATMSGVLSLAYFFKKRVLLSDVPFFKQYEADLTTFFAAGDKDDLCDKMKTMLNSSFGGESSSYNQFYSEGVLADAYYNFYKSI